MSDKYRIRAPDIYARRSAHPTNDRGVEKIAGTVMDVTKLAVVGGVAMGLIGAAGGMLKK
jgi:hypothetical protein